MVNLVYVPVPVEGRNGGSLAAGDSEGGAGEGDVEPAVESMKWKVLLRLGAYCSVSLTVVIQRAS